MQPSLYVFGRLKGRHNLCYANAAFQCLLSWAPFIHCVIEQPTIADGSAVYRGECVIERIRKLRSHLISAGDNNETAVQPFMQWVFNLSGVTLCHGKFVASTATTRQTAWTASSTTTMATTATTRKTAWTASSYT